MVIAIIGRSYSGKRRLAKMIEHTSKRRFRLFKQFTTRPDFNRSRHMYIPAENRPKIAESNIFYSVVEDSGWEYFSLKSQFKNGGDLIYVMDDPRSIEKIDQLGIPYAVVYVDCNTAAIVRKAKTMSARIMEILSRFTKVRSRLRKMKRSGEYTLYINTSELSPQEQGNVMASFYHQFIDWSYNCNNALHPGVVRDEHDWARTISHSGYMMSKM